MSRSQLESLKVLTQSLWVLLLRPILISRGVREFMESPPKHRDPSSCRLLVGNEGKGEKIEASLYGV